MLGIFAFFTFAPKKEIVPTSKNLHIVVFNKSIGYSVEECKCFITFDNLTPIFTNLSMGYSFGLPPNSSLIIPIVRSTLC